MDCSNLRVVAPSLSTAAASTVTAAKLIGVPEGDLANGLWYSVVAEERIDVDARPLMLVPKSRSGEAIVDQSRVFEALGLYGKGGTITVSEKSITNAVAKLQYDLFAFAPANARKKIPAGSCVAVLANPAAGPRPTPPTPTVAKKVATKRKLGETGADIDALLSNMVSDEAFGADDAEGDEALLSLLRDSPGRVPREKQLRTEDPLSVALSAASPKGARTSAKPTKGAAATANNGQGSNPDSIVTASGQPWYRVHRDVLGTVLSSSGEVTNPTAYFVPSTHVALFAINGTLFDTTVLKRGPDAFTVSKNNVREYMGLQQAEGRRIVWVASYGSLDHAPMSLVEEQLGRIEKYYHNVLGAPFDVTVLISIASALRRSPYTMPEPGLWQLFTTKCCAGSKPHLDFSCFVGNHGPVDAAAVSGSDDEDGLARGTPLDRIDSDFAANCKLRFLHASKV